MGGAQTVTIFVLPEGRTILGRRGETVLAALWRAGIAVDAPCGGKGLCGKCRVSVAENGGAEREVSACSTILKHDLTVRLRGGADGMQMLTKTHGAPHEGGTGAPALAFDVGTTTIAAYLVDSGTGRELASSACLNPQSAYGSDVIARLSYALEHGEKALTNCVRTALGDLALSLCGEARVSPDEVAAVSVVGNTAMQHLFLGLPVDTLARAPFHPASLEAFTGSAHDFGLPLSKGCTLLVPPVIAGFVGADTVACLLDTNLDAAKSPTMLIDIGTNGELVLAHDGVCTACSTAAGPAFEGARIEMGLRAEAGAIDKVAYAAGSLSCSTVRGAAPRGVCGSGLVDAVAMLLDTKLVTPAGRLLSKAEAGDSPLSSRLAERSGQRAFLLTTEDEGGEVFITQQDLRELQLAKGAIRTGVELLAENACLRTEGISRVIMAGAFGCYLNARSALRIGLLPAAFAGRIVHAGNAAGGGAKRIVSEPTAFEKAKRLAGDVRHLELEKQKGFLDAYMASMSFEMQ